MGGKLEIDFTTGPGAPPAETVLRAAEAAVSAAGVADGHLAIVFVADEEIRALNRVHRDRDSPTDVLSFPIDEDGPSAGPRELGDVVVCAARCTDPVEAVVHGVLHLCGHDHETDGGQMLALQDALMEELRR